MKLLSPTSAPPLEGYPVDTFSTMDTALLRLRALVMRVMCETYPDFRSKDILLSTDAPAVNLHRVVYSRMLAAVNSTSETLRSSNEDAVLTWARNHIAVVSAHDLPR